MDWEEIFDGHRAVQYEYEPAQPSRSSFPFEESDEEVVPPPPDWPPKRPLEGRNVEGYILALTGTSGRLLVDSGALVSCCSPEDYPAYVCEQSNKEFNLKTVTGDSIKHYGTKKGVELTGQGGEKVVQDFQVTSCARAVLSVSERTNQGQVVVFGPDSSKIVTDSVVVKLIQKCCKGGTGFRH